MSGVFPFPQDVNWARMGIFLCFIPSSLASRTPPGVEQTNTKYLLNGEPRLLIYVSVLLRNMMGLDYVTASKYFCMDSGNPRLRQSSVF